MSFNSTGLDSAKVKFTTDICEEFDVDFLAIQEHFKFVDSDKYFKTKFSDYSSYVIPGYRAPGQVMGRARAGLAQLCMKDLDVKKTRVATTGFRVQAQVIHLPTSRVLWLNTYLPTDPQLQNYDDQELQGVLLEVRNILESSQYDHIIWGSGLNWDPIRNTQFSRALEHFVAYMGLVPLWENHPVPYTHVHTDGKARSVLDHFLISPCLLPLVEGCGIVERGDNRSRHCPIWLKIRLGSLPIKKPCPKWIPRRPDWSKATPEDKSSYSQHLEARLQQIQASSTLTPGLSCKNLHCKDFSHSEARDGPVLDLLSAVIEASHVTLPSYGGCWVGKKRPGISVPGWTREVQPYREAQREPS